MSDAKQMKRVFFYGAPVSVEKKLHDINEKFIATGSNTGNLLIGDGLARILDAVVLPATSVSNFNDIDDVADLIALPSANFLSPKMDISWLLPILESSSLPVMMVGVGAQFPNNSVADAVLPQATIKIMKMISERSELIGVRGEFTADVLIKHGIKNIEVTGCPSMFRKKYKSLKINKVKFNEAKFIFNGSTNVTGHSENKELAQKIEYKILKYAMDLKSKYVLQNEVPEIFICNGIEDAAAISGCNRTMKCINMNENLSEYVKYIKKYAKIFFNLNEWEEFVARHSVSVGTRFHGNMMALSQGIMSIFVVHDSRTRELCDTFKIPGISMSEFENKNLRIIMDEIDFNEFEKSYSQNMKRVISFINKNGLNTLLE